MSSVTETEDFKKLVSDMRDKHRNQAINFAKTKKYKHTNDINVIPLHTQFYEVNTNSGDVSSSKKRKNDTILKPESTAPYFIITDDTLKSDSIVAWSLSKNSLKGGKRTRIRKSSQKRTTTKRR